MNYPSLVLGWSIAWAGLALAGQAHAQAVTPGALSVMDIDGSGTVDQAEHGIAMGAAFAHADKNADGVLDADEAAMLSLPSRPMKARSVVIIAIWPSCAVRMTRRRRHSSANARTPPTPCVIWPMSASNLLRRSTMRTTGSCCMGRRWPRSRRGWPANGWT